MNERKSMNTKTNEKVGLLSLLILLYLIELAPFGLSFILGDDPSMELSFLYSTGLYGLAFSYLTPARFEILFHPTCVTIFIIVPIVFAIVRKKSGSSLIITVGVFTFLTLLNALTAHIIWLPGIYG